MARESHFPIQEEQVEMTVVVGASAAKVVAEDEAPNFPTRPRAHSLVRPSLHGARK